MAAAEGRAPAGAATLDRHDQLGRLRDLLEEVLAGNPFWRDRLRGTAVPRSADDFRRLPFTSNQELSADARAHPPFGSNLTYPLERYIKFHQTSGTKGSPLTVLDTDQSWDWWCECWGDVLGACEVGRGDRAFFAFSFGPFIGFWSAFDAARSRGVLAVQGGGASTPRRLRLMADTGCNVLLSTPTYALHMAETGSRLGFDVSQLPVRKAVLAGEPGGSLPAVRRRIEQAWGAEVFDHAGTSEVGAYGLPCPGGRGVLVNEREFIAEVVRIGGSEPVSDGEAGELVMTNLGRAACPVIRYRTGDMVRPKRTAEGLLLEGGILGRIDEMILLRGVNLHPSAIEEGVRREVGAAEFRITVDRAGQMDEVEVEVEAGERACGRIGDDIRNRFGVRVTVRSVTEQTLPRWEAKAKRFRDLRT